MGTCLTPAAISNAEESFNREIARNYANQNDGRALPTFIFASFREFRGESISSVQHLPQFQTLKSHSTAKMRETTRTRTTGAQCQSSFSRPFASFAVNPILSSKLARGTAAASYQSTGLSADTQ
jgi:hypothetical protein